MVSLVPNQKKKTGLVLRPVFIVFARRINLLGINLIRRPYSDAQIQISVRFFFEFVSSVSEKYGPVQKQGLSADPSTESRGYRSTGDAR